MAKEIPVNEVLSLYDSGKSVLFIGRTYRIGTQRIISFLKENGKLRTKSDSQKLRWEQSPWVLPKRTGKEIPPEAIVLFKEGKNPSQIAHLLGVGARRVKKFLIENDCFVDKRNDFCEICKNKNENHKSIRFCIDCAPDKKFMNLCAKYGVSKPIWDSMIKKQNNLCVLCPRAPQFVDHCHKTGKVRGLLCPMCNAALGRIEEDNTWAERALEYLK